jgi:Pyridoxamine 5'-phosphate oxidase
MYRALGSIKKTPNVGLLFVRFDGKSRRIRINGKASIHAEREFLERHYGAKFVVRIECKIYASSPHAHEETKRRPRRRSGSAGTIFERSYREIIRIGKTFGRKVRRSPRHSSVLTTVLC